VAGTGDVSTPAVAAAGAGALVLWASLKGISPTKGLLSLLQGKQPSTANTEPITGSGSTGAGAALQSLLNTGTAIPGVTAGIPAGVAAGGTPTANMALGQLMAGTYGWTGNNWLCLKNGWQEESGWSQYAANVPSDPYNHAYGIPQANPGTKMASAGADWKSDPATQIRWGLAYIKATYGSPSQVPGWTPDGPSSGYVGY
jgi:hypothetical protein